ncbi:hypothetical protein [Actinomadura bangladeshensis]|uniref:hypothetical protein n=1 Tax=Actinomadura bangladeshensis TaxID=453573 RepID=UPI001404A4C0|nr:hypothetical protein [Actinomadura bangladeshensis]
MSALMVPVHLDALCLADDQDVTGPSTDFTRLPYVDPDTGRDVSADLPYLGESLLSAPFQHQNLRLKAGIHLHWALPDALTRLLQVDGTVEAPVVPDRWLVTRSRDGAVDGQWVVESDVFSEDGEAGVAYPVLDAPGRPYRRLGRRTPLPAWTPARDPADRLAALSVVGHGDPAFAAFYPNCHSVFGFHDPDFAGPPPAGLRYDVMGWYQDADRDELAHVLRAPAPDTAWQKTVADRLGWAAGPGTDAPRRMLCFGQLTFAPAESTVNPLLTDAEPGVCVGHTATEALAAHLGAVLPDVTPEGLEDLLEALTFAGDLESSPVDLSIGLAEARHTATFAPLPGGTLWTVQRQDETAAGARIAGRPAPTARERQDRARIVLPPALDALLGRLNEAQEQYDRARQTLTGLRGRLFADWHKYLVCANPPDIGEGGYPDPSRVAFFLERAMADIDDLEARTGTYPPQGPGDSLAHRLDAAHKAVDAALAEVNAPGVRAEHVLREAPAPDHYRPNDPVVLLTGSAATPSDRYGQDGAYRPDGLLPCALLDDGAGEPDTPDRVAALRERVAGSAAALPVPNPAVRRWEHAPWHPVLLQWEAEFFPVKAGGNLDAAHREYAADYVTRNYALPDDGVELRARAGEAVPDKGANVYTGTTVLSPAARPVLSARILYYLAGNVLDGYNAARRKAGLPTVEPAEFRDAPGDVLDWYEANGTDARLRTLTAVHRHLSANADNNLSQSLGGFNDALLMLKLARQLPVADPVGFPMEQDLAGRVAARVGGENRYAPQPNHDFNPIRAGEAKIERLRVVDNFGIGHDVDVSRIRTTTRLRAAEHPDRIAMPPRLVQAARLRLRLLDAGHDTRPLTGLPECSPVCGWLVPDNLDDSLRVYAADGTWLGSLSALADPASWEPAPYGGGAADIGALGNAHLRKVVAWVRDAQGAGDLLGVLDDALAAVEPADAARHRDRAVLAGRPVAVVRAEVSLDLREPPAVHQDWNIFRTDLGRGVRETNGYPLVRFPVRVGEAGRLGDGTLCYWLERPDGTLEDRYHAPLDREETPLLVAADLAPRYLTLLADPRAAVHATTGILPTASVRIAAEHQAAAQDLEAGFLAAPVLTDADRIAVPLPAVQGSFWSWRERDGTAWLEISSPPTVRRTDLAELDDATWRALTRAGWLTEAADATALVTPADRRPALPSALEPLRARIEALLDRPGIEVPHPDARFPAGLTVREGELVLRALPPTEQGNP